MIFLILLIFGLAMGSFVNAFVWRFYKNHPNSGVDKLKKRYSIVSGRSMCTHCEALLAPKDLVPVISWIMLRGKCRYCRKPIQDTPLPELLTPALFIASYYFWPFGLTSVFDLSVFVLWLLMVVLMVFLFVYDLRWMILPNVIVAVLTVAAIVFSAAIAVMQGEVGYFWNSLSAGALLFMTFYLLFVLSKGTWIGGGDVKLLFGLGLISGSILNGLLVLFLASFMGSVLAVPKILLKDMSVKQRLPFGPLLITASFIVFFISGAFDISEYLQTLILMPL